FVTPLWGLSVESDVQLETGASISLLNDDDVVRALRMQVVTGDHWSRSYRRDAFHNQCLRRRIKLPKTVVDRPPTPDEALKLPAQPDAFAFSEADQLLTLLPLVSAGHVRAGATMRCSRLGFPWSIEGA